MLSKYKGVTMFVVTFSDVVRIILFLIAISDIIAIAISQRRRK